MLTAKETQNTKAELQENYRRLGYPLSRVLADTGLSERQVQAVLEMSGANPSHVWMMRDYLEDMLRAEGKEIYPWTRLADHSANRWFHYETPWR